MQHSGKCDPVSAFKIQIDDHRNFKKQSNFSISALICCLIIFDLQIIAFYSSLLFRTRHLLEATTYMMTYLFVQSHNEANIAELLFLFLLRRILDSVYYFIFNLFIPAFVYLHCLLTHSPRRVWSVRTFPSLSQETFIHRYFFVSVSLWSLLICTAVCSRLCICRMLLFSQLIITFVFFYPDQPQFEHAEFLCPFLPFSPSSSSSLLHLLSLFQHILPFLLSLCLCSRQLRSIIWEMLWVVKYHFYVVILDFW